MNARQQLTAELISDSRPVISLREGKWTSGVMLCEGRRRKKDTWTYILSGEPDLFAGRGFTGTRSVSPCFWERSEAKAVGRTNPAEQSDSGKWLPWFNLYNMNGRLYDPVVGRFLSPDNYVQDPFSSQNYNRYSYVLNNPLKYTDVNGELGLLAGLAITLAGS